MTESKTFLQKNLHSLKFGRLIFTHLFVSRFLEWLSGRNVNVPPASFDANSHFCVFLPCLPPSRFLCLPACPLSVCTPPTPTCVPSWWTSSPPCPAWRTAWSAPATTSNCRMNSAPSLKKVGRVGQSGVAVYVCVCVFIIIIIVSITIIIIIISSSSCCCLCNTQT